MTGRQTDTSRREELLAAFETAGRVQAMRTVMFHTSLAHQAGLNVTDFNCVNLLGIEGPLTPGEIAQRTGLTRGGAVTAMLDRLERAGYVRRRRDDADRRRVHVELVPEVAFPRIVPLFADFNAGWGDLLASYDDDQLALLLDFVQRGNEVLHDATRGLQDG